MLQNFIFKYQIYYGNHVNLSQNEWSFFYELCKNMSTSYKPALKLSFNTITFKIQMLEASKIAIKVYANQDNSLSVYYKKTVIKHVFV